MPGERLLVSQKMSRQLVDNAAMMHLLMAESAAEACRRRLALGNAQPEVADTPNRPDNFAPKLYAKRNRVCWTES